MTALNEIEEKLKKAAYTFGTHFSEGDETGQYNDALIALHEALTQLAALREDYVIVPKSFFRGRICSCGMLYNLHCKCEFCGNGSPHIPTEKPNDEA